MNAMRILGAVSMATVAATLLLAPSARADDGPTHRLGDHPAIVVQRLHKAAGYDYASKFYPHPATLRPYAVPPRDATGEAPPAAGMLGDPKALPGQRAVAREAAVLPKAGTSSGG